MNNRKNNGWILCPSKSFPGKFYYFNVLNGEAAWCLNETENSTLKSTLNRVTDKHNYPEPNTPPTGHQTTNFGQIKQPLFKPSFGQALFPKYIPNEQCLPQINWTSVSMPPNIDRQNTFMPNIDGTNKHVPNIDRPNTFAPNINRPNTFESNIDRPIFIPNIERQNTFMPKIDRPNTFEPYIDRPNTFVQNIDNPNTFIQNIDRPNTFVPNINRLNKLVPSIDRQNTFVPNINGLNTFVSNIDRPNTFVTNIDRPHTFVPHIDRPHTFVPHIDRPNTFVPSNNRPNTFMLSNNRPNTFVPSNNNRPNTFVLNSDSHNTFTPNIDSHNTFMPNIDRQIITKQKNQIVPMDLDQMFVQASKITLNQRFDQQQLNPSNPFANVKRTQRDEKIILEKPIFKRVRSCSESDVPKNVAPEKSTHISCENIPYAAKTVQKPIFPTFGNRIDDSRNKNPFTLSFDYNQNPTKNTDMKMSNKENKQVFQPKNTAGYLGKEKCALNQFDKVNNSMEAKELDRNDLRYILVAKRKKTTHVTKDDGPSTVVSNEIPHKKKVTFDFGNLSNVGSASDDTLLIGNEAPNQTNIQELRNLSKHNSQTDWYIAVDLEVLLEDYQFVESYINSDESCFLLVPYVVHSELKEMSMGDARGRSRVMSARQLVRKLAAKPPHIVVEPPDNNVDPSKPVFDQILDCCLNVVEQEHHLVLITNSTELYDKSSTLGIHTFKLEDIKEMHAHKNTTEVNEIKICVENESNLFLQNPHTFNPFALSKPTAAKENRFDGNKNITLPVQNEQVVNENNTDDSTSEIGRTVEKLTLQSLPKRVVKNNLYAQPFGDTQLKTPANFDRRIQIVPRTNYEKQNCIQNEYVPRTNEKQNCIQNEFVPRTNKKQNCIQKSNLVFQKSNELTSTDKRLNINSYTINDSLRRFYIRNMQMEIRVKSRLDEWICCWTQIMEEFLSSILQSNPAPITNNLLPPWTVSEALDCVQEIYKNCGNILTITSKMLEILCSCKDGNLRNDMISNEFMKILGCSIFLIDALETVLQTEELSEAKERLANLLHNIEDPNSDPDPPQMIHTPLLAAIDDDNQMDRKNFVIKPSEVIQYLKKHYPAWRAYIDTVEDDHKPEIKEYRSNGKHVLRTFGCNLNSLKINKHKQISFDNTANKTLKPINRRDPRIKKMMRNCNINDSDSLICGTQKKYHDLPLPELMIDDSDSGFENESLQAYSLVKIFLIELSESFKLIYFFIEKCISDLRFDMQAANKKDLQDKVMTTHTHIAGIIEKLKSIIERESGETTILKKLMINAGAVASDKRISRYRQVVTKCLEQAQLLENALNNVWCISNEDFDSIAADTNKCNTTHINIFE